MPVRLAVTGGTVADCSQALPLIEGIEAECLLADKAYDTNEIIPEARKLGMDPVTPPKRNRKEKRDYDQALYRLRHLERTRYAKAYDTNEILVATVRELGMDPVIPPKETRWEIPDYDQCAKRWRTDSWNSRPKGRKVDQRKMLEGDLPLCSSCQEPRKELGDDSTPSSVAARGYLVEERIPGVQAVARRGDTVMPRAQRRNTWPSHRPPNRASYGQ